MKRLEFKTTGDWNLQGNNKKEIYISLVAKINDWKKNIVFCRLVIGEIAFDSLLQQILNHKDLTNWEFSVSTKGGFIHSIFVSQVFYIKNQDGNTIFATEEEVITW